MIFCTFFWGVYLMDMNQRDARQRLLNFPASEDFIQKINSGVVKSGAGDRSKFIRDAIREKLEKMGIEVPVEIWSSRPRFDRDPSSPQPVISPPEKAVVLNDPAAPYIAYEPPAVPPVKPSKKKPQTPTP